MSEITRAEHLAWCKERSLEYVDAGNLEEAFASFASDITKHPDTENMMEIVGMLGLPLLMNGHLNTTDKMREHINGYN